MSKTLLYCVASALAIGGCASERQPTVEISRARSLIDQANQTGAQQFAAADIEAAHNKLQQAEAKHTDHDVAKRLADEASIDAEVATARTQAGKAQQALNQVEAASDTLRQETAAQPQQP